MKFMTIIPATQTYFYKTLPQAKQSMTTNTTTYQTNMTDNTNSYSSLSSESQQQANALMDEAEMSPNISSADSIRKLDPQYLKRGEFASYFTTRSRKRKELADAAAKELDKEADELASLFTNGWESSPEIATDGWPEPTTSLNPSPLTQAQKEAKEHATLSWTACFD